MGCPADQGLKRKFDYEAKTVAVVCCVCERDVTHPDDWQRAWVGANVPAHNMKEDATSES